MRIGIDGRELFANKVTGIGRYLRDLLGVVSRSPTPHQYLLYGNQHTSWDEHVESVEFVSLPQGMTLWWDQMVLRKRAKLDNLDVFFSPYTKGPVFARCPVVITIHDLIPLKLDGSSVYGRVFGFMAKFVARRVAAILADSEHTKRDILELLGVPEAKIHVIPLCVNEAFRPAQSADVLAEVKRKYSIAGDYVFYVGNFDPHKNLVTLLRAYAALPEDLRAAYQLVLGGKLDEFTPQIRGLAAELGVGGNVVCTDFIDQADLPALYRAATLFAFPSKYEGFGLPPLEAMACGVPVVSSNATSLPEVVGEAALTVDPEDVEGMSAAMRNVLSDQALRATLATKGIERARLFTQEKTATETLRVIEAVAG